MMTSSNGNIYWPFMRGIHRSPVNSPHKDQWRGALMFSLICALINNREAGDLRRYRANYNVILMIVTVCTTNNDQPRAFWVTTLCIHNHNLIMDLCHAWSACSHFDEIFINGCPGSCQNDNFQCSQWWKFRQNDIISVALYTSIFTLMPGDTNMPDWIRSSMVQV